MSRERLLVGGPRNVAPQMLAATERFDLTIEP
jgi:hypothetical protein